MPEFDRIEAENARLSAQVARLVEALQEIAHPIAYMRKRADAAGAGLNGQYAVMLSESANHLKSLAAKALSDPDTQFVLERERLRDAVIEAAVGYVHEDDDRRNYENYLCLKHAVDALNAGKEDGDA